MPFFTFFGLLMCLVPQFTAATGIITIESVILPTRFYTHAESEKDYAYKRANEYANNVKQCCEVCKKPVCSKHSPKNISSLLRTCAGTNKFIVSSNNYIFYIQIHHFTP